MKKFFLLTIITLTIFIQFISVPVHATSDLDPNLLNGEKQVLLDDVKIKNEITYNSLVELVGESKFEDTENNRTIYKKAVHFKESYSMDNIYMMSKDTYTIFTYDSNKVWIEDFVYDFVDVNPSLKDSWRISSNKEVLIAPNKCIVSFTWKMYQNQNSKWRFYDNSYVDISCSKDGVIDYRID